MLANPIHERFAQELASGKSATEAYRIAAGKENRRYASDLGQRTDISGRVQDLLAERAKTERKATEIAMGELAVTKKWVIAKLVENVERGLQARAMTDDEGNPIGEYKYDGGVVNKALELLGKEQGMFIERRESGKPGDFAEAQSSEAVLELVRSELGDDAANALSSLLSKQPKPSHDGSDTVN